MQASMSQQSMSNMAAVDDSGSYIEGSRRLASVSKAMQQFYQGQAAISKRLLRRQNSLKQAFCANTHFNNQV